MILDWEKNRQVTFQKTKLALGAMTQHDTNYAWKLKTELRVVFAMHKQRFKHSESRKRVSKTQDIHMLCTS